MTNKFLILIFICISINAKAQNIKAKVFYKVANVNVDSTKIQAYKNIPSYNEKMLFFEKINALSKEFKLELVINNGSSFFSNTFNPLQLDLESEKVFFFAVRAYKVKDKYYYNKKDNELIVETVRFGEDLLISKKPSQKKWTFINESKKIGEYLCYKAYRVVEHTSLSGEIKKTKQIVWYTPEIPLPYGPKEFVGFPGLVLEVTKGKIQYTATKIVLNPKEEIEIKKPTKGIKITEEEYKGIGEKSIDNTKSIFGIK